MALAFAAVVFVFGTPLAAAGIDVAAGGDFAAALTPRRLSLLARGAGIALAGALLAQLLATPLAIGFARPRGCGFRTLAIWLALATFLTPTYVYTYAWSLPLLPEGLPTASQLSAPWPGFLATYGRAIWCLGCWLAPLAAVILACGWSASGRPAWLLAITDATPARALFGASLSALRPWLFLSLTTTVAFALTEFAVCHLSLVPTWNVELFAELQVIAAPGRGLALAWPLLVVVMVLLSSWLLLRRRVTAALDDLAILARDVAETGAHGRWGAFRSLVPGVGALLLLPWLLLVTHLHDWSAFGKVWRVFPDAWPDGLLCGAGAMLLCVVLAVGVDMLRAAGPHFSTGLGRAAGLLAAVITALAALFAVAPPALVGDSFLAAYTKIDWISDHALIVSGVGAARFALIPIALTGLAAHLYVTPLTPLALSDRAGFSDHYWSVRFPLLMRPLLLAATVSGLLSLTEIAASQMVTPPGVKSLAVTLLNQIHFGRSDNVIAMCLYVLLLAGGVSAALAWPRKPRRR